MPDEAYESRLQKLWQQGQRGIAVNFLRKAISGNSTLADVLSTLNFPQVRTLLHSIRLSEVMSRAPATAAVTPAAAAAAAPRAPRPAAPTEPGAKARRQRRGPAQMVAIKEQLWAMLEKEPGSLDTTQLHEGLAQLGHEVDRITLKRLLCQLADEHKVTCLGGRPKAWRQLQPAKQRSV